MTTKQITQRKLKEPFNLHSDGGPESLIVGFGVAVFDSGCPAIVMINKDSGLGTRLSVNLPDNAAALETSKEFFLKNWTDMKHIAERLVKLGIVKLTGKAVASGHIEAPIATLNDDKFTEFNEEELKKYNA